jgi:hypothetical protein
VEFGLKYYGARFYDSALGRFVSSDTITPRGAQGLDRYAYANNSPMRFSDPSGHSPQDPPPDDTSQNSCDYSTDPNCPPTTVDEWIAEFGSEYGVIVDNSSGWWDIAKFQAIASGMEKLQAALGEDAFTALFTGVKLVVDGISSSNCTTRNMCTSGNTISIGSGLTDSNLTYLEHSIVHEFGHVWDNTCNGCKSTGLMKAVDAYYYRDGFLGLFGEKNTTPAPTHQPLGIREIILRIGVTLCYIIYIHH